MKQITVSLVLTIFTLVASLTCLKANDGSASPQSAMTSIELHARSGWMLWVWADGSAKVQFGSGPFDNAKASAGTVNFAELRRIVEAQLQPSSNVTEAAVVGAIRSPGQVTVTMRPLESATAWNEAVAQLTGKLKSPAQNRFEALTNKVPLPVPQ